MTRPRVLLVTPRFPYPLDRGDRLHAYHLLRVFADRFDVTLVAFEEKGRGVGEGEEVFKGWGIRVFRCELPRLRRFFRLASGVLLDRPLQVSYYLEPSMRELLSSLDPSEGPFDALVCHLIRTTEFAGYVRARVKVADLADSLTLSLSRRLHHAPILERPSIWLEAGRVRRFERRVLDPFSEGWVVSDVDQRSFPGRRERLRAIPAGVDPTLFEGEVPRETDPVIGFLGHLSVPHNVDAVAVLVESILPRVRSRGIEARVRLIGADPSPLIRRLSRQPGVEWAGYVPDLRRSLQSMRVLCAPIRFSAGVQSKLIDAVAAGVPVVTSPEASAALGFEIASAMETACTPEQYVEAIERLWGRGPETIRKVQIARNQVRKLFRWEAYADRLEELLASNREAATH